MKLLTTREVADRLNVTSQTVRNWDKTGKLRATQVSEGGTRFYSDEDVEKFILENNISNADTVIGYYKGDEATEMLMRSILECENKPYEIFSDDELQLTVSDAIRTVLRKIVRGECSKVILMSDTTLLRYHNDIITEVAKLHGVTVTTYVKNKAYSPAERKRLVEQLLKFNLINYSAEIEKYLSSLTNND